MSHGQGNFQAVNNNMIRIWLRDKNPDANLLIDDLEFEDDEINLARIMTVSYWNESMPPGLHVSASNIGSQYFILKGICGQLLLMAANRYRRNSLQMSAGGVTVDDQNKHKEYEVSGTNMWQEFVNWVARAKVASNMAKGWGTI